MTPDMFREMEVRMTKEKAISWLLIKDTQAIQEVQVGCQAEDKDETLAYETYVIFVSRSKMCKLY